MRSFLLSINRTLRSAGESKKPKIIKGAGHGALVGCATISAANRWTETDQGRRVKMSRGENGLAGARLIKRTSCRNPVAISSSCRMPYKWKQPTCLWTADLPYISGFGDSAGFTTEGWVPDEVIDTTQEGIMKQPLKPSFVGLNPASPSSSRAARGASRKKDTLCELSLRRELWSRGLRYRLSHTGLPGRPDIVFLRARVVVFCDGDFWHGRNLDARLAKLARGHNASYWIAKICRNVERDLQNTRALEAAGWVVLRFWETDLLRKTGEIADRVSDILAERNGIYNRKVARSISMERGGRRR